MTVYSYIKNCFASIEFRGCTSTSKLGSTPLNSWGKPHHTFVAPLENQVNSLLGRTTLGSGGAKVRGQHLYRGGSFARKCISTTPIGEPIYIWPRPAMPPAPPLTLGAREDLQK